MAAPTGRATKPTENVANAASVPASGRVSPTPADRATVGRRWCGDRERCWRAVPAPAGRRRRRHRPPTAARRIQPGEALPTERELAEDLGVSRNVLRQALERLCRQQAELQGERYPRDHYDSPDELGRMRAERQEIAMAIAGRDENRARTLVEQHLERTRSVVAEEP